MLFKVADNVLYMNSKKLNEMCDCCKKDEFGNWISEPCCNNSGVCDSGVTNEKDTIGNCIHCGGEMFKEGGIWWHHTQAEIPIDERGIKHYSI